jgi:hypothetical protein
MLGSSPLISFISQFLTSRISRAELDTQLMEYRQFISPDGFDVQQFDRDD